MSEARPEHVQQSSDDLRLTNVELAIIEQGMTELAKKLADDAG